MTIHGTCSTLMLAGLVAGGNAALQAQQQQLRLPRQQPQWIFGAGASAADWLGRGADCGGLAALVNPALMFTAEHPLRRSVSLAFTARLHVADGVGASCVPAAPGTYVSLTDNPLGRTFAAADGRIEYTPRLGWLTPMVGLGVGSLFSNGTPAPYGLVAGGFGIGLGKHRLSILGEYQRLRLWGTRVQHTFAVDPAYAYPVLVSQQYLGRGAIWRSAGLIALRFDFAVKTHR